MKTILQSRTFWAQVIGAAVLIGSLLAPDFVVDEELQTGIVGGLWACANIILRLLTSTPVTLK